MKKYGKIIFILVIQFFIPFQLSATLTRPMNEKQALQNVVSKLVKPTVLPKDFGKQEILTKRVKLACEYDGYPKIDSLKKLVTNNLLRVKQPLDLTIEIVAGGTYTDRIYAVRMKHIVDRAIFFLKISRKKNVSKARLINLQKSLIGRLGIDSRYADTKLLVPQKYLPIMCWVETFFEYKNNLGENCTLEVMHGAHGESGWAVYDGANLDKIKAFGRALGLALGSFQQVFMDYVDLDDAETWTTVAHKDLHFNNMFFDEKTLRVYFIDFDTMKQGASIYTDLESFISRYPGNYFESDTDKTTIFIETFFISYINSFSVSYRPAIAAFLKGYFPPLLAQRCGLNDIVWRNSTVQNPKYGLTPLIVAIALGDKNQVQLLLDHGESVIEPDIYGDSPFYWALRQGQLEIAKLLMQHGVDINSLCCEGRSFLNCAILANDLPLVNHLIFLGADVNLPDTDFRETPLRIAVDLKDLEIAAALLKAKEINVNALNEDNETALFLLTKKIAVNNIYTQDDLKMAQMLVKAGVDRNIRNKENRVAFDLIPQNMQQAFQILQPSTISTHKKPRFFVR